jgi:hypothetical protein
VADYSRAVRCARKAVLLVAALAPLVAGASAPAPESAPAALKAAGIDHFYNLEYGAAIEDFKQLTVAQPGSASAWNHLAQAEIYAEMLRIGALESQLYGHGDPFLKQKLGTPSPAALGAIHQALTRAQTDAQAALARAPGDAHARYNLAVVWALRANAAFSLRHAYWTALGDAKQARKQAQLAVAADPAFVDPQLILGVQSYVAGSLPWAVRMFSTLVGYSGNKEQGRRQIAYVAAHGEGARTDAAVLLAVADRRDGLNRQAAPIFLRLARQYPRNDLFAVEAAEALEAAGEHAAARTQFHQILARAASGAPGYAKAPLGRVWYDLGGIASLYSNWSTAAHDYGQAAMAPNTPAALRDRARQLAQAAQRKLRQ